MNMDSIFELVSVVVTTASITWSIWFVILLALCYGTDDPPSVGR